MRTKVDTEMENVGIDEPKAEAVAKMIKMIHLPEQPIFAVLIKKYYIEDVPYKTLMFTVSKGHTSDIKQTDKGFVTTGVFKESMVHKAAKENKKIKNGLVKVQLEVRYEDIWGINGQNAKGEQINLYSK